MYTYNAKLDRVVDGDTVDALVDLGFDTWKKVRIRFYGIDAYESRTRDLEEKEKGLAAKQRVIDHTFMELGTSSNKQVQINFEGVKPIYKNYIEN